MKFSEAEQKILDFWKKNKIFEKSISQKDKNKVYGFYDGPPFITGVPHYGSLLSSIVKDAVPRYWTMKGYRVTRRWGWDCHGLPAENMVEKKLGIKSKEEIEKKVGIETFCQSCFAETSQIASEWEDIVDRIGRWVEFKGAYKTMDNSYMESVWWAFSQLHKKGLIYEDVRVSLYCPRCSTPLSNFEIAMDNSYQEDTDPSVYIKFPVKGEENTYFLVWTTTPWTLLANTALAVGKKIEYAKVRVGEEYFWLAKDRLELLKDYEVVEQAMGERLTGLYYTPIFTNEDVKNYRIINADFVSTDEGTGIVHLAPAFGDDDFVARQKYGLDIVLNVDDEGRFIQGQWQGQKVWAANKDIVNWLKDGGVLFKQEMITHSYPHCHRCAEKLIYKAQPAWFVNIAKLKPQLLKANEKINWYPESLKNGRFKKSVQSAPDWNISRTRYWGTPMPVWKCEKCNQQKIVSSIADLGQKIENIHRPHIDQVEFDCECGGKMKRIPEVFDCWVESGSMPFAQFHYPFENKKEFEKSFPTDFVSEYIAQTRAWFYVMHVMGVALFGQAPFRNVLTTGVIAGSDGRKMSKSFGNYTDPYEVLDNYSADALRFYLLSSPLLHAQDINFSEETVRDISRNLLSKIRNSYSFLNLYTKQSEIKTSRPKSKDTLDRWIISRLHSTILEVDSLMQSYDLVKATRLIDDFVDDLSNWYIRRSRARLQKPKNAAQKKEAVQALGYVLWELSKLAAPFIPFVTEEIYQNLKTNKDKQSVHLCDYPKADKKLIDPALENKMATVREIVARALGKRDEKQIKVRQPLASLTIKEKLGQEFLDLIAQEVNVKEVKVGKQFKLDTKITKELQGEGDVREIERFYAMLRKEEGLNADDEVSIFATSSDLTSFDNPNDWRAKKVEQFDQNEKYDAVKDVKTSSGVEKIAIKR